MRLSYKILLMIILCLSFKIYAAVESYNSFRVQCDTLVGSGYVMVWFGLVTSSSRYRLIAAKASHEL
jgi:hypothetical protein